MEPAHWRKAACWRKLHPIRISTAWGCHGPVSMQAVSGTSGHWAYVKNPRILAKFPVSLRDDHTHGSHMHHYNTLDLFLFKIYIFIYFRKGGGGRNINDRESLPDCLLHFLYWGLTLKSRHVPLTWFLWSLGLWDLADTQDFQDADMCPLPGSFSLQANALATEPNPLGLDSFVSIN